MEDLPSNEQCSFHPGWLFDIGDEIQSPIYVGILISHYKGISIKQPVYIEWNVISGSCCCFSNRFLSRLKCRFSEHFKWTHFRLPSADATKKDARINEPIKGLTSISEIFHPPFSFPPFLLVVFKTGVRKQNEQNNGLVQKRRTKPTSPLQFQVDH